MRHPSNPVRLVAALVLTLAAHAAGADDTPSATPARNSLAAARGAIAAADWRTALAELRRAEAPASADWNNLMGYVLRKGSPPDLAAAERHYDAALRIQPDHRDALEYSGELYLMTGRLPEAEQRLAALDRACRLPCEQYDDLKKAVAAYRTQQGAQQGAAGAAR